MPDRLWMFNPGCPEEECCEDDTPNTPCCGFSFCGENLSKDPVTLTDEHGSHVMTWDSSLNTWRCCYNIASHPTTRTTNCSEAAGTGPTSVIFSLGCSGATNIYGQQRFSLSQIYPAQTCFSTAFLKRGSFCSGDGFSGATGVGVGVNFVSDDGTTLTFNTPENRSDPNFQMPAQGNITVTRPNVAHEILYLSDGFGTVTMIYNGPRPVAMGTASDMWWGCATRSVTNGRVKATGGGCEPTPVNFDTEIIFGLWCKGLNDGYRLYIIHDGCGYYDNGIDVQTHQIESLGCSTPWIGQYNQIVGGSLNGIPAGDCSPFVFGPVSQSFPATPYPAHPLREIYGDSATWTITE